MSSLALPVRLNALLRPLNAFPQATRERLATHQRRGITRPNAGARLPVPLNPPRVTLYIFNIHMNPMKTKNRPYMIGETSLPRLAAIIVIG